MLAAAVLAVALRGLALLGLADRLPRVPEGDSIVVIEKAFDKSLALGAAFERSDARLRQWPAAGLSLVLIALLLAAATSFSR